MNIEINFFILLNEGNFSTRQATFSFSRRNVLHEVSESIDRSVKVGRPNWMHMTQCGNQE